MTSVLGIDAAWTHTEPSGVALVERTGISWRLVRVAASYQAFLSDHHSEGARHRGSTPNPEALLSKTATLTGRPVSVVAIDMPLSTNPINGRRVSDNAISVLYGARHAGTHTPSQLRPGKLSDDLTTGFAQAGYPLLTLGASFPALIEVYPHPALIELAKADRRLPYKHAKSRKYWPDESLLGRRHNILGVWAEIVSLLDCRIQGVASLLPLPDPACRGFELKAFEDSLDAVVCAWIGTCVLDGRAKAYGDDTSAIWVPTAGS
jgi:predicted RNase H-like nuclease